MSTLTNPTANHASKIVDKHMVVLGKLTARNIFTENEWKQYTPTVTGGGFATTRTVNLFKFRVIGSVIQIKVNQQNTAAAGATSTAAYQFSLPTGCVLPAASDSQSCGSALLTTVASGKKYTGSTFVTNTGTSPRFGLMIGNEATAVAQWGNASPHATDTDLNFAGGIFWSADFSCELDPTSPILLVQNN